MNMVPDDVTGVKKDRQKIGSSLADVDPMTIDTSVRTFVPLRFFNPSCIPKTLYTPTTTYK